MSLKSREVRRLAMAGATAIVALGAAAGPAAAATNSTLTYTCVYPLINGQRLVADVTTNIPSSVQAGQALPAFQVDVIAHALDSTYSGLELIGASGGTIEGTATAVARVDRPGAAPLPVTVPITIPQAPVPTSDPGAAGLTIPASGVTPSITLVNPGTARISVESLTMNIKARNADGDPITGAGLGSTTDSDGDPETFDVPCTGPSVEIATVAVIGDGPTTPTTPTDTVAPTKPGTPTASQITSNSVKLDWSAATDNVGVTEYEVYQNGNKIQSVLGTTATAVGLTQSTSYSFTVVARDLAGNSSPASNAVSVTTSAPAPTIVKYKYALTGSSDLKTLTKGSVPLKGDVVADLNVSTGAYTGTTVLVDAPASLKALGFLPITAVIGFTEIGGTSGALTGGVLTANTKQNIRLKSAKSLGINLIGNGTCQTKTPSAIALKSGSGFQPTVGGTVTGTYSISALTGCGLLNGLVSGLTAGSGNTITAKLTPKA